MDPITTIMAALVAGATAKVGDIAGKTVSDAYDALKQLIIDKYKRPSAVAAVEEDPSSESQHRALEEALVKARAADDPELLEKAKAVTEALAHVPPETLARIGVHIGDIRAMNLRFEEITVEGPGSGVVIDKADIDRDANFGPVRVGRPDDPN